jgi:hypothetical protein
MVAQADLAQVKVLTAERLAISNAMYALYDGAQVISFSVALNPTIPPQPVTSDYIDYPPQMNDAISNALNLRQQEIIAELGALGVTELEPLPPPWWSSQAQGMRPPNIPEPQTPTPTPLNPNTPQSGMPTSAPPPSAPQQAPKPQPKPAARKRK